MKTRLLFFRFFVLLLLLFLPFSLTTAKKVNEIYYGHNIILSNLEERKVVLLEDIKDVEESPVGVSIDCLLSAVRCDTLKKEQILEFVEQIPEFPGGNQALKECI